MIITREDSTRLNYLAHGNGAKAIEDLADMLWNYYAKETVLCPSNQKDKNSGKAELAIWLKSLPKGLQNGIDGPISTGT